MNTTGMPRGYRPLPRRKSAMLWTARAGVLAVYLALVAVAVAVIVRMV